MVRFRGFLDRYAVDERPVSLEKQSKQGWDLHHSDLGLMATNFFGQKSDKHFTEILTPYPLQLSAHQVYLFPRVESKPSLIELV